MVRLGRRRRLPSAWRISASFPLKRAHLVSLPSRWSSIEAALCPAGIEFQIRRAKALEFDATRLRVDEAKQTRSRASAAVFAFFNSPLQPTTTNPLTFQALPTRRPSTSPRPPAAPASPSASPAPRTRPSRSRPPRPRSRRRRLRGASPRRRARPRRR